MSSTTTSISLTPSWHTCTQLLNLFGTAMAIRISDRFPWVLQLACCIWGSNPNCTALYGIKFRLGSNPPPSQPPCILTASVIGPPAAALASSHPGAMNCPQPAAPLHVLSLPTALRVFSACMDHLSIYDSPDAGQGPLPCLHFMRPNTAACISSSHPLYLPAANTHLRLLRWVLS